MTALGSGTFSHTFENMDMEGDPQARVAFSCGVLGHVLEHHADDAPAMACIFLESVALLAAALDCAPAAADGTTRMLCDLLHRAANEALATEQGEGVWAPLLLSAAPALLGALQRYRGDADVAQSACGALALMGSRAHPPTAAAAARDASAVLDALDAHHTDARTSAFAAEALAAFTPHLDAIDATTLPVRQRVFASMERICAEHGADAVSVYWALNLLAQLTAGHVSDPDAAPTPLASVLPLAVAALQRHAQSEEVCKLAAGVACNVVQTAQVQAASLALAETGAAAALHDAIRTHGDNNDQLCGYAAKVLDFVFTFGVDEATAAVGTTLTAKIARTPAGLVRSILQAARTSWAQARARAHVHA